MEHYVVILNGSIFVKESKIMNMKKLVRGDRGGENICEKI
jgi:hypothetical protein